MKYRILHQSAGRIRLRVLRCSMTMEQADILQAFLQGLPAVQKAKVNERTLDAVLLFRGGPEGVLQPTTTSLLHNLSTLVIGMSSMTDLLQTEKEHNS